MSDPYSDFQWADAYTDFTLTDARIIALV